MKIMGIDLGIAKVAYSIWEDGILTGTEAHNAVSNLRHVQLMEIGDFIYSAAHHEGAEAVWIEETLIGNNRKYSIQLSQTMGSVLSSLGLLSMESLLTVYTVNVSTWKKAVIGSGNANKEAIRSYVMSWESAYSELCGYDQDRFDAACIGYYGVILDQRVDQLRLVREGKR